MEKSNYFTIITSVLKLCKQPQGIFVSTNFSRQISPPFILFPYQFHSILTTIFLIRDPQDLRKNWIGEGNSGKVLWLHFRIRLRKETLGKNTDFTAHIELVFVQC